MKTIRLVIPPTIKPDDLVIVCYRDPRGGRTDVKHKVRAERWNIVDGKPVETRADTAVDVARELVAQAKGDAGWAKYLGMEIKGKDATIVVHCPPEVAHVVFDAEIESPDGTVTKIELEEL